VSSRRSYEHNSRKASVVSDIIYTSTMLAGTGRKGIIKPDAAGYYTSCIGALGIKNAAGVIYDAKIGAKLFESNSDLMRRIATGNLRGEVGHPRRQAGMSDDEFFQRCLDIAEPNVCVYWAEIGLDEQYGRKNPELGLPEMVGIMARFRPGGARGDFLARDMEDPNTNVCFSIRAFSVPFKQMGRPMYGLQTIATWDYVNEPGLSPANKFQSLTCEALNTEVIKDATVQRALREIESGHLTVSFESAAAIRTLAQLSRRPADVAAPTTFLTGW